MNNVHDNMWLFACQVLQSCTFYLHKQSVTLDKGELSHDDLACA